MSLPRTKKIEDMNAGELEIALFERRKARIGGTHVVIYTVFAIFIFWALKWWVLYWLGAAWLLFIGSGLISVHNDIKEIEQRLNDIYGG